ncbi:hypothetical protein GCM10023185_13490 [Hymenobacter saemangeumensis]|uniref:T9SS type A sorting domain-containing protein n=1 Tax=Hymenobacter saemangeumensis TaxID=1084522 RepID=A0ABP8I7U8_9BACT
MLSLLLGLPLAPAWAQRFAAIGDYGYAGSPERDVSQLVKSWSPEFIITLGDNNYDVGAASTIDDNIGQYYHEFIAPYQGRYGAGATENRFFPSLGNHDLYTNAGAAYLAYFTLPGNERYYDFVRGNVHFFAVNSDGSEPDGTGRFSAQARWLKERLAASTAPWKVVYFHHAPYSSGSHGSDRGLRWPFREWGASLVLTGHDHTYERVVADGLVYCVNGLGGRSLYSFNGTPLDGSAVRYNADYGAQLLEASADSLRLRFYTRTGQLIDDHTLVRGLAAEPQLLGVYPLPISEAARVEISLPAAFSSVRVRVLDARGRQVATLHQGPLPGGRHELQWSRQGLAAGTYFVQLQVKGYAPVKRTVVL